MMTHPTDDSELIELRYSLRRHNDEARRIRQRMLELNERGVSLRSLAQWLDMPPGTVHYWIRQARDDQPSDPT